MDACLDPEIETKNLNLAGLLFEKTMDYPTLHSSHTMNRAICTALSNRIPQVIPYISARMVKSKQLSVERMMNNALKKEKAQKVNNFVYVAEEFPIWANKAKIAESIFEKEGIPNKLDLCFFDISYITDQSLDSDKFFETLAFEDIDMNVFDEEIVQIIIERAW